MSESYPAAAPVVPLSALMAQVGYFLFHWSTLEQALNEGIVQARGDAAPPPAPFSGTFKERVDHWCKLMRRLHGNERHSAVIEQIGAQAMSLRKIRNSIVHGLMAGNSMPIGRSAYITCLEGGYDSPTGRTLEFSIEDLEHLTLAIDACRRGFRHLDAFNHRLHSRFRES